MAELIVKQELVTPQLAKKLVEVCPFDAISYDNGSLAIGAGCKMCKICVKNGEGAILLQENAPAAELDKTAWCGIAVYADFSDGSLHGVTLELLGKARELAAEVGHPVYALAIGSGLEECTRQLLKYGADKVFVYDAPELKDYTVEPYTNAFEDFINTVKPSSVLVGATMLGRGLAPRVAARMRTGLTADCTQLEIKPNTDLVQIRPAFGGNIMAQIITPNTRPQFCTVRYKVFSQPEPLANPAGEVVHLQLPPEKLAGRIQVLEKHPRAKEMDLTEAETIVTVGRGVKSKAELELVQQLADRVGAQLACTRPLVESGWFDPRRQIGLSGRTVAAKLIITVGISGAVQFAAGMRNCECIIAINTDAAAPIFDVAHVGLQGDWQEILPVCLQEVQNHV